MKKYFVLACLICLSTSLMTCKFFKSSWENLNVFPVSQDIELGKQVSTEIEKNPVDYPILSKTENEELYKYINELTQKILNTRLVDYAKDFQWKVTIINDPKTLNAFCTPGGYIYVYTGLINFLESEDQLAGVLGHEIAHAANRHSTKQLTKSLGVQILLDAALGNKEVLKQVTGALVVLSFSRAHETQADSFSVKYLCATNWKANGAAGFFRKIEGQPTPPQWISTHPSPANRIKEIDSKAITLNCQGTESNTTRFAQIKALLSKIPPPPPKPNSTGANNKAPSLPTKTQTKTKTEDKPAPSNSTTNPQKKVLKKGQ